MKNLFCLTDQAIQVLKTPGVKWKLMYALEINDTRTLDKHVKNNFPNSPLMNFNVREIIRDVSPNLDDKDIYRKLSYADVERVKKTRQQMQEQNTKYNNLKRKDTCTA